jgi:hypothetical protein
MKITYQHSIFITFSTFLTLNKQNDNIGLLCSNFQIRAITDKCFSGDNDGDVKVTIAVVLGVGLTVIILGCFGFFLCRGHFERKKFHIHGQLVKMERKNKVLGT